MKKSTSLARRERVRRELHVPTLDHVLLNVLEDFMFHMNSVNYLVLG